MKKELTHEEFVKVGLLDGYVVEFEKPLQVKIHKRENRIDESGRKVIRITPTGETVPCKFMRVTGGFGACVSCSGTMIMGNFFTTLEDAQETRIK